jgi:hypothetical protein
VFQLWSHTYLYKDPSRSGSWPFPKSDAIESSPSRSPLALGEPPAMDDPSSKLSSNKNHCGMSIIEDFSSTTPDSQHQSEKFFRTASSSSSSFDGPTIRFVGLQPVGIPIGRHSSAGSDDIQDMSEVVRQRLTRGDAHLGHCEQRSEKAPKLSWFMTVSLLTTATIVSPALPCSPSAHG